MSIINLKEAFKYQHLFDQRIRQAKERIENPENFLKEVLALEALKDSAKIHLPSVDRYQYELVRSKGFLRYPERLKNLIKAEEEPWEETRSFYPTIMDIEPNSRCNFRCVMCQVSEWDNGKRAQDMTYDDLVAFIRTQPLLTEVKLHGMGEPLMHKQYIQMIEFLVSEDIWTRTTVNGSLLHVKENYKKIIDAGIGEMQCSFDGATKDVFESIRKRSNYEQVLNNLTKLNKYANQKDRLYTRMWVLLQETNRHQLFDFVERAIEMNFRRMSFSVTLNDWGQEGWLEKNSQKQIQMPITQDEEQKLIEISKKEGIDITIWRQSNKYHYEGEKTICPWPFTRPYISSDLKIVPCCMMGNPEVMDLGDATQLNEVWNGKVYQDFRKAHLSGNLPKACLGCYRKESQDQ